MDADAKIDTVIVVHSETSTTAVSDIAAIAKLTRGRDALLLVDGITAVGCLPVKMDEWGVDVYVTGSQKAMMLPPGLAFAAVNDRAWARVDSGKMPTLYNDLKAYRKSMETWDAPYTPAVSLVRGTVHNLRQLKATTLEAVWHDTATMAKAARAAAAAMKLELFAADPADSVTAMVVPAGVDEAALRKTMSTKYGFHIAGGQGDMKGKIVRFSHMGYVDVFDLMGAIAAFELTLKEMGFSVTIGNGVAAVQEVLASRI
jgi:aspartate aminotransferase-like enzyme